MRKSKVLSFVLVAALAVTAIPINAFGTVSDEICRIRSNRLRMKIINYRNLSLMHRSIFSQLIRS